MGTEAEAEAAQTAAIKAIENLNQRTREGG